MMIPGLRLTDGIVAGPKAIAAGKPVSAGMLKTLATLRLINNALQLTPAGTAVLEKPSRKVTRSPFAPSERTSCP